jgi:hypothetical protein
MREKMESGKGELVKRTLMEGRGKIEESQSVFPFIPHANWPSPDNVGQFKSEQGARGGRGD